MSDSEAVSDTLSTVPLRASRMGTSTVVTVGGTPSLCLGQHAMTSVLQ